MRARFEAIKYLVFVLVLTVWRCVAMAQRGYPPVVLVSYNVENLFSPWKDTLNPDTTYTPGGEMHWTQERLRVKAMRVADAVASVDAARPPAVIGLCEVEDSYVLRQLLGKTFLKSIGYCRYHRDSPDLRGIDVALLYDTAQVAGLGCRWLRPEIVGRGPWQSREILYARFRLPDGDTLHIFQNHWPSKYSGAAVTVAKREAARSAIMRVVYSLLRRDARARIVAMGDFNEDAGNELFDAMSAASVAEARNKRLLVNLFHPARRQGGMEGSHKFQGRWAMIDNFFVSSGLMEGRGYCVEKVEIFAKEFLLERDSKYGGVRPRRTYQGPRYSNLGTSDHLPIVLRLKFSNFAL